MKVALFDLEKTLLEGYAATRLFKELWAARIRRSRLVAAMLVLLPQYYLVRAGILNREAWQGRWLEHIAACLQGVALTALEPVLANCTARLVPGEVRPHVHAELLTCRAQGYRTILVSGAYAPLLDALAEAMQVDVALGTPLGVAAGRLTGALTSPPCLGDQKVAAVTAWARAGGVAIDWQQSRFYTDSISDLPLLERVGEPVAVHPDPDLRALAAARGWRVLEAKETD